MYSLLPCQGEREPEGASLRRRKRGLFNIQKLAYTLDDASGEAFDKVSKMLGGSYPG
ncbi:MAG: hypothetical protein LBO09_03775 [Candidatus Peribacteria bacterium]|jgi:hypothetical protein|nr:hypothetical protein [Candidatus Peribacteria bacterium]